MTQDNKNVYDTKTNNIYTPKCSSRNQNFTYIEVAMAYNARASNEVEKATKNIDSYGKPATPPNISKFMIWMI